MLILVTNIYEYGPIIDLGLLRYWAIRFYFE